MMNENVARDAAPKTAPMATSAKAPADRFAAGKIRFTPMAKTPPMAALDINMGASSPPDVPEPSEMTSAAAFATMTTSNSFQRQIRIQNVADGVIADAQHAGHEVADDPEPQGADRRPPEFVDRQFLELVFGPVQQLAEADRGQSANQPEQQIERQRMRNTEVHRGDLEHRTRAQQLHVDRSGERAGNRPAV